MLDLSNQQAGLTDRDNLSVLLVTLVLKSLDRAWVFPTVFPLVRMVGSDLKHAERGSLGGVWLLAMWCLYGLANKYPISMVKSCGEKGLTAQFSLDGELFYSSPEMVFFANTMQVVQLSIMDL